MTFDNQLFRCSSLGRIMTNDKSGKKMGETSKSYLKELFREVRWGVRKDFTNKYVEKGLAVEDTSIQFYSNVKGGFYSKNEEFYVNEFISGSPDIVSDKIIDIKSSWNAHTFPFKDDPLNKDYFAQVQGYMWLTGLKEAVVAFVLIDTPVQLIEDEKRRISWKMGMVSDLNPEYLKACEEIEQNHTFSHIPDLERVIEYEVRYDEEYIEKLKSRILECRNYLNSL